MSELGCIGLVFDSNSSWISSWLDKFLGEFDQSVAGLVVPAAPIGDPIHRVDLLDVAWSESVVEESGI